MTKKLELSSMTAAKLHARLPSRAECLLNLHQNGHSTGTVSSFAAKPRGYFDGYSSEPAKVGPWCLNQRLRTFWERNKEKASGFGLVGAAPRPPELLP